MVKLFYYCFNKNNLWWLQAKKGKRWDVFGNFVVQSWSPIILEADSKSNFVLAHGGCRTAIALSFSLREAARQQKQFCYCSWRLQDSKSKFVFAHGGCKTAISISFLLVKAYFNASKLHLEFSFCWLVIFFVGSRWRPSCVSCGLSIAGQ